MARGFSATLGSGSTDKIATTYAGSSSTRTYACWAYRRTGGGNWRLLCRNTDDDDVLYNNTGTKYQFTVKRTTAIGQWSYSAPATGAFHHVCWTYDDSSTANDPIGYLDGASQTLTEDSTPSGTLNSGGGAFLIGNRVDSARAWDGYLAEVAIWDVVLDAAEVAALADGAAPSLIRPGHLVEYVPLVRDNVSLKNAAPTITGTAVQPHPRVIYPGRSSSPVGATVSAAGRDVGARLRLAATAWKHAAARFRLLVNATQDAGARFRLTTPQFRDAAARFSLLGSTVRDVATRFRVEALGYSDRAGRFRLQGRTYADVAARFKLLGGQTARDVAVRLRLAGQSTSDRALRLRLRATAYSNRAVRFVVRVAGFKDRGARFILNRIVHLNSGVNTPFGGSSSTVQISTNFTPPQTGSTLLAHVFLYGTPSLTPANGWTQAVAATTSDALQKVAVFYRRSGPSDSALSTETVATLSGACFWLSAYDEYRALGALLTSTANASDGATKTSSATSPPAGRFALGIASACTFGGGPTAWSNQALSGASPLAVRTDTASVDPLNPTHSIDLDIFDGFVRDTAGSYTATVDDSSMALGAVTLVFFETNHEWSRDVGTRFSITPPVFRNVAARFRVVRGNFSHRALRFVLRATAYRDQTVRFLLVRGNVKDASARLRLRAEAWADGSARFTLGITTWSHVATRFILKTAAWSDRSVRLVLRATSWRDTAARFAVGPPNWAHVAVRFRLLASAWRDRTVRFRLAAAVWSDRTLRFRLRLQAYRDATVRFVLATPNWANAALRFVLRAFARQDVATRFRVEVSAVSVSHGGGSGAQIQTGDQRNDTTPTVETAGQSGSVTVQTGS